MPDEKPVKPYTKQTMSPSAPMASPRMLGLMAVMPAYQTIEMIVMMTVPQKGVMYLGWTLPKILGKALCEAIDSVDRVSGRRVVRADAAPDVNTATITNRNRIWPGSEGPPTARASGVKMSAQLRAR